MTDANYGPMGRTREEPNDMIASMREAVMRNEGDTEGQAPVEETPDPEVARMIAKQSESQARHAMLSGDEIVGRDSPVGRGFMDPPPPTREQERLEALEQDRDNPFSTGQMRGLNRNEAQRDGGRNREIPFLDARVVEQREFDAQSRAIRNARQAIDQTLAMVKRMEESGQQVPQAQLQSLFDRMRAVQDAERNLLSNLETRFDNTRPLKDAVYRWTLLSRMWQMRRGLAEQWEMDREIYESAGLGDWQLTHPGVQRGDLDQKLRDSGIEGDTWWHVPGNILGGALRGLADAPYRINDGLVTALSLAQENILWQPNSSPGRRLFDPIPLPERGLSTIHAGFPESISGSLAYGITTYAVPFAAAGLLTGGVGSGLLIAAGLDALVWNPQEEGSLGTVGHTLSGDYMRRFEDPSYEPPAEGGERWMWERYQDGWLQTFHSIFRSISADTVAEESGEGWGRAVNVVEGFLLNLAFMGMGAGVRKGVRAVDRTLTLPPPERALEALRRLGDTVPLNSQINANPAPAMPDVVPRAVAALDDLARELGAVARGEVPSGRLVGGSADASRALPAGDAAAFNRLQEHIARIADRIRRGLERGDPNAESLLRSRFGEEGLTPDTLLRWMGTIEAERTIRSAVEVATLLHMRAVAQRSMLERVRQRNLEASRTPFQHHTLGNARETRARIDTEANYARSRAESTADPSTLPQGSNELARQRPPEFAGEFRRGLADTARDHKFGFAVEVKDLPFYQDPSVRMFAANDGSVGVAVTPEGDVVSVFRHPDATQSVDPAIRAAIRDGGITLDAFDINGVLPGLYGRHGMRPVARVPWNDAYAPPGWNYDIAGRPDVLLMVHDPAGVTGLPAVPGREAGGYAAIRDQIPLFTEWSDAVAARRPALEAIGVKPRVDSATATRSNFDAVNRVSAEDILNIEIELEKNGLGLGRLEGLAREHAHAILTDPMFGLRGDMSAAEASAMANAVTTGFGLDPQGIRGAIPDIGTPFNTGRVLFQKDPPDDGLVRPFSKTGIGRRELTESIANSSADDLTDVGRRLVHRLPSEEGELLTVRGSRYSDLPSVQPGAKPQFADAIAAKPLTDSELEAMMAASIREFLVDSGVKNIPPMSEMNRAFEQYTRSASVGMQWPKDPDKRRSAWVKMFGADGEKYRTVKSDTGFEMADGINPDIAKEAMDNNWLGKSPEAMQTARDIYNTVVGADGKPTARSRSFQPPRAEFYNRALQSPGSDAHRFWYELGSEGLFGTERPLIRFTDPEGNSMSRVHATGQDARIALNNIIAETSPRTAVDDNFLNAVGAFGALERPGDMPLATLLFPSKVRSSNMGQWSMRPDANNYKVTNFSIANTSTLSRSERPAYGGGYEVDINVLDVIIATLFRVNDEAWSNYGAYSVATRFHRRLRNALNDRQDEYFRSLSFEERSAIGPYDPMEIRQIQALPWTYWNVSGGGKDNPSAAIANLWNTHVGQGRSMFERHRGKATIEQRAANYPETAELIIDIAANHPQLRHYYEGPNAKVYRNDNGDVIGGYLDSEVLSDPAFERIFFVKSTVESQAPMMRTQLSDMGLQSNGGIEGLSPRDEAMSRLTRALDRLQKGVVFGMLERVGVSAAGIRDAFQKIRGILTSDAKASPGLIEVWRRVTRKRDYKTEDGKNISGRGLVAEMLHTINHGHTDVGAINYTLPIREHVFGDPVPAMNRQRSIDGTEASAWESALDLGNQFDNWQLTGPFRLTEQGIDPGTSLPLTNVTDFGQVRMGIAAVVANTGIPQRAVRYNGKASQTLLDQLDNPLSSANAEQRTAVRITTNRPFGTEIRDAAGEIGGMGDLIAALPHSADLDNIHARTYVGQTEVYIPGKSKQEIIRAIEARRVDFDIQTIDIYEMDPRSFTMGFDEARNIVGQWRSQTLDAQSGLDWWRSVNRDPKGPRRVLIESLPDDFRRDFLDKGVAANIDDSLRSLYASPQFKGVLKAFAGTFTESQHAYPILKEISRGKVGIGVVRNYMIHPEAAAARSALTDAIKALDIDPKHLDDKKISTTLNALKSMHGELEISLRNAHRKSAIRNYDENAALLWQGTERIREAGEVAARIDGALDEANRLLGLDGTASKNAKATIAGEEAGVFRREDLRFQTSDNAGVRGALWEPDAGGITFIKGFTAADRTTGAHEMAHALVIQAESMGGRTRAISEREWKSVREYFGAKDGNWSSEAHERFADVFAEALTSKTLPGDMTDDVAKLFLRGMAEIRDAGLDYKATQKVIVPSAAFQSMIRDMESLPLPIRIGHNKYANPVDWSEFIEHANKIRSNGDKWQDVISPGDILAHARIFQSDRYPGMIMHRDHFTGRISFVKSFWAGYDESLRKEMRRNTHFHRATREEMFETMAFFEDFVRGMRNADPILARQPLADAREGGLVLFARLMNQPDGDVHQLLKQMMEIDLSAEQLSDRVIGARLFMMFQLDETLKASKKARETESIVDYAILQREFLIFQQVQHHVAQLMSQAGRALRAIKDPARLPTRKELSTLRKTDEFWEQLGRDQRVGPELADMLDGLKLPEHGVLAARIIEGTNLAGPVDRITGISQEVYVNALLSAPRTFVGLTTAAPAMMTMIQSAEHLAGALIRRDGEQVRAVFRDLRRKWQDLGVSLKYAVAAGLEEAPRFMQMRSNRAVGLDDNPLNAERGGRAITAEAFGLDPGDWGGWLVDLAGEGIRGPTRSIMTTDEFFRQLNGRNGIYAKSYDEFMSEALKEAKETGLVVTRSDEARYRRESRPLAERYAEAEVDRMIRDGRLRDRQQVYRESLETHAVQNAPTPFHKAMEVVRYMEENFTHRTSAMVKHAEDHATRATMQGQLERGSPAKMVQGAVDQIPLGRVIIPFYRTPVQIFRRFGNWMPTTLLAEGAERLMQRAFNGSWKLADQPMLRNIHSKFMADLASGDPRRMAEARGQQAFGLGLVTLGSFLAYEGLITGAGPKDPDRRSIWLQSNQPYSLRIGESWVSYQKMAPVGQYFGIMADAMELLAAEEYRGGINGEKTDLVNGLIYAFGQQVRNMPMLQGVSTIMDALERNDAYGQTMIRNTAVAFTPFSSGQRAVNQVTDGTVYEVRSLLDAYRVRTWFGDASKVAPARTPLGETLTVYPPGNTWQPWVNLVNPMMFVTNSPDPVYRTINEIGMYLSMPDPVTDSVDYSNIPVPGYQHSAYDWWMERIGTTTDAEGRTLRNMLESYILPSGENHIEWLGLMAGQDAPPVTGEDTPAARMIRTIVTAYHQIAYVDMLQTSPEAMRLWEEARSARVAAYEAVEARQKELDEQLGRVRGGERPLSGVGTGQIVDRIREAAR